MKRVLFVMMALAATAGAIAPAMAQEEMKLGLGYFRPEAPVGGRAWINEKTAVDFGVGFDNKEVTFYDPLKQGGTSSEKKTSFTIDAGLPYVLKGDETTKFFVRPGITFNSSPVYDNVEKDWATATQFWVAGSLGVEHWFGKHFSLSAAHGLLFKSIDPGTKGSDSTTQITTEGLGISNLGFHFYFK